MLVYPWNCSRQRHREEFGSDIEDYYIQLQEPVWRHRLEVITDNNGTFYGLNADLFKEIAEAANLPCPEMTNVRLCIDISNKDQLPPTTLLPPLLMTAVMKRFKSDFIPIYDQNKILIPVTLPSHGLWGPFRPCLSVWRNDIPSFEDRVSLPNPLQLRHINPGMYPYYVKAAQAVTGPRGKRIQSLLREYKATPTVTQLTMLNLVLSRPVNTSTDRDDEELELMNISEDSDDEELEVMNISENSDDELDMMNISEDSDDELDMMNISGLR